MVFAADPSVSRWAPNDQPVISGDGTADIARKAAGGTYATLATGVALPWTDTTGGLIEGSNDGVGINATELVVVPGAWANRVWVEAVIPDAKRGKYRYYWLAPRDGTTTSWRGNVREVQFFGVKPVHELLFMIR